MPATTAEIISTDAWRTWQAEGHAAQLIDVRSATEFATAHLPGAINIPLEQIELRTTDLNRDVPVILVCQAGTRARMASELLSDSGLQLAVLEGGTEAWIEAGFPVVRNTAARWALERQVRLIAGLLVGVGAALGALVSPWWLLLPALMGCGLTFAGITGLCPMGEVLVRLPWNRQSRSRDLKSGVPGTVTCACKLQNRE